MGCMQECLGALELIGRNHGIGVGCLIVLEYESEVCQIPQLQLWLVHLKVEMESLMLIVAV